VLPAGGKAVDEASARDGGNLQEVGGLAAILSREAGMERWEIEISLTRAASVGGLGDVEVRTNCLLDIHVVVVWLSRIVLWGSNWYILAD